jgi:hypothetical protein
MGWAALELVAPRHARADAGASLDVPQVLGRVAPAIVKVNCGERWGTGTLFGDSQHVVTSFALINRGGAIVVHLAGGRGVSARVVAWSREDAIVLLKLGRSAKAPALAAAETPPSAGDAFLMPYHPRDTTLDPKNPGEAQVPLPVFGRVGRTGKTQLDLDARNIDQPGLSGAPVLSANGTLLGFLDAERSWEQRRVIATRVERAERLFAEREKAGEFSPDTHTSWFAGLFGVLGPEQSMGFGGIVGYRFEWLRLGFAGVGLSSGYRPIEGLRFRKLERSAWDLQVAARIEYQRNAAFLVGPALSITLDSIHRRGHEANGALFETIERKARVRPVWCSVCSVDRSSCVWWLHRIQMPKRDSIWGSKPTRTNTEDRSDGS